MGKYYKLDVKFFYQNHSQIFKFISNITILIIPYFIDLFAIVIIDEHSGHFSLMSTTAVDALNNTTAKANLFAICIRRLLRNLYSTTAIY